MNGLGRRAMLAAVLLAGMGGVAQAHGPTRQKLVLSVDVAAPPAKVWAVIGNFQDMGWVPGVAKVTGTGGNDPAVPARRDVTLKSGAEWKAEELDSYDAAQFKYGSFLPHVDPKIFPVADYSCHIVVTEAPGGKSHVAISAAFYRGYPNNDPPPEQNEAAAIKAVTDLWQPALDGLKAKFGG